MKLILEIESLSNDFNEWRQSIHQNPELAFEEYSTGEFIATQLETFGINVTCGIGKTGVVGTLKCGESDKSIGFRADMDALPMDELNTFSYKSKVPGKMHGCGHDGHTVILLAAAQHLAASRCFNGTVHFIFQPAEEANPQGSGAKAMIDDGLLQKFPMDQIFALHNAPGLKAGAVATCSGAIMASMDIFEVTVHGQGTHGAIPHTGIDTLVIGSQLIMAWQTIVSRTVNAMDSAVISTTSFQSGDSFNVIPNSVTLRGTVRTLSAEVARLVQAKFCQLTEQIVTSFGGTVDITYRAEYPVTTNSEEQTRFLCDVAASVVGDEQVISTVMPVMGSEDFSHMLNERPGCYFFLGNSDKPEQPSSNDDKEHLANPQNFGFGCLAVNGACMTHDPNYDFNDSIIPVGASIFVKLAERYLVK